MTETDCPGLRLAAESPGSVSCSSPSRASASCCSNRLQVLSSTSQRVGLFRRCDKSHLANPLASEHRQYSGDSQLNGAPNARYAQNRRGDSFCTTNYHFRRTSLKMYSYAWLLTFIVSSRWVLLSHHRARFLSHLWAFSPMSIRWRPHGAYGGGKLGYHRGGSSRLVDL
ncbi:hypothetical protein C8R47DRAFT_137157 [Mycena vitilis]|nr:hypothetical protein C8R47DRAFT_137157 [Mycena vitilis]